MRKPPQGARMSRSFARQAVSLGLGFTLGTFNDNFFKQSVLLLAVGMGYTSMQSWGTVLFSLMAQYTPQPGAEGLLRRRVTGAEYRAALQYMENLGIVDGYCQDSSSAKEEYTPPFDLTGV